jgi:hypothetical protein
VIVLCLVCSYALLVVCTVLLGQPVRGGDHVRLEHIKTRKNLHSHNVRAHQTGGPGDQHEVSCFEHGHKGTLEVVVWCLVFVIWCLVVVVYSVVGIIHTTLFSCFVCM